MTVDPKMFRVNHVAIVVKSIAPSVDWYVNKFNCEIKYQDESWALLGFENMNLALVLKEQHPAHVGISVDDVSEYGEPKTRRDGSVTTYIKDLDGNVIELIKE